MEFPVYEPTWENVRQQSYSQETSIDEIEDQMDDWLQDRKAAKKKVWLVIQMIRLCLLRVRLDVEALI